MSEKVSASVLLSVLSPKMDIDELLEIKKTLNQLIGQKKKEFIEKQLHQHMTEVDTAFINMGLAEFQTVYAHGKLNVARKNLDDLLKRRHKQYGFDNVTQALLDHYVELSNKVIAFLHDGNKKI